MTTIEEFSNHQKEILDEYIERTVGPYQHNQKYYTKVLEAIAGGFYSGVLSPDDVSTIAEEVSAKVQGDFQKFRELPNEFTSLMEVEWELRNNPQKAINSLLDLKKYLAK